jgi:hypothetical protein
MIHEYAEPRCNNTDRKKMEELGENLSQCQFAHHRFHRIDPGAKPDLHG